ncbi:MAG TPA: serine/threonine-protein kinase, partial [Verrucomicrobiae bacterium]
PKLRYVGDYELIEEIAHGGMGVVYKARQLSLNRLVAVKMILAGKLASGLAIERFQNETEAAAQLDHPNIVPIFEVGQHDGLHYFSMKLVEGRNLAQAIGGQPMELGRAVEIMIKVARAVHYAHQRGILHRDLKPANILLGADDEPHVTDFGLAKLLEKETSLTQSMEIMGSPAYMAPEVAMGRAKQATTAADVYSMGAVLYEMLTGRPSFEGESYTDILRKLVEEEPKSPRSLNRQVDPDLQTICLKCLHKDAAARYGSAEQIVQELILWKTGKPIAARAIGNGERFWRWCKRKPALAATGAFAALLLVVISIGGPIALWRINQAKSKADLAAKQAVSEKKVAQTELSRSREIVRFLKEMLANVGPSVALGRDTVLLREILDNTAKRITAELTNQPAIEAELRSTLATTYTDLGEYKVAEEMLRRAITISTKLYETNSLFEADEWHQLGGVLYYQNKLSPAEAAYGRSSDIYQRLVGTNSVEMAGNISSMANLREKQDKFEEAEKLSRTALALKEKFFDRKSPDIATALCNLANLLGKLGKFEEAEKLSREAFETRQATLSTNHPHLQVSMDDLANILTARGKLSEAVDLQTKALAMRRRNLGDSHPSVATSLCNLANVQWQMGKLSEAEANYREAIRLEEQSSRGTKSPTDLSNLAGLLTQQNRLAEAEELMREAVLLEEKQFGADSLNAGRAIGKLAQVLFAQHKLPEAEEMARRAMGIWEKERPDDWRTFSAKNIVGGILLQERNFREAEPLLMEAYRGLKQRESRITAAGKDLYKSVFRNLAALYLATNRSNLAYEVQQELKSYSSNGRMGAPGPSK